jgi:hypothetical protein
MAKCHFENILMRTVQGGVACIEDENKLREQISEQGLGNDIVLRKMMERRGLLE